MNLVVWLSVRIVANPAGLPCGSLGFLLMNSTKCADLLPALPEVGIDPDDDFIFV